MPQAVGTPPHCGGTTPTRFARTMPQAVGPPPPYGSTAQVHPPGVSGGRVTGAMQVLVVHAHPSRTSFSRSIADTAESTLKAAGHDVTVVHLDEEHFRPAMSAEE